MTREEVLLAVPRTNRGRGLGLGLALALCQLACSSPTGVLRLTYGPAIPLSGAPPRITHEGGFSLGAIQSGSGARFGGAYTMRVRPAGDVLGGSFGASLLSAYVPESTEVPFLYTEAGAGVLGGTSVRSRHESTSFDFMSPLGSAAAAMPLTGGLAVSLGLAVEYVNRLTGQTGTQNVLLLTPHAGFGFFDPHAAGSDNWLNALGEGPR